MLWYLTYCDHIAAQVRMHIEAILLLTKACYTLPIVGCVKAVYSSTKYIQSVVRKQYTGVC